MKNRKQSTCHTKVMPVPITIDANSPCFNINIGRLGSAPPYRRHNNTMTTEATLLPKLNGHWSPADSRVYNKTDSYNRIYYGTKTPRKSTASPKKSRVNDHKLVERQKTVATSITTARSNHRKDTVTMKRLVALNGKIQDRQATALRVDKLKIQGVGVNGPIQRSPTKLQADRNTTKKIDTTELVSPLLNALRTDNTQSAQYKKLLNRNSFLSAKHPTQIINKTSAKPRLETRYSLDEQKLLERRGSDEKTLLTIREYLRRENARYIKEEESVKKILFQNWLHNIQIVTVDDGFDDDGRDSIDCSVFDLPVELESQVSPV